MTIYVYLFVFLSYILEIDFKGARYQSCRARHDVRCALAVVPFHYDTTLAVVPPQLSGGTTLAVVPCVVPVVPRVVPRCKTAAQRTARTLIGSDSNPDHCYPIKHFSILRLQK